MIDIVWALGFLASVFVTMQVLPQTYKMWKLRHKEITEFSKYWFFFGNVGSALFIVYGLLINQIGLIILNIVCLVSMFIMTATYLGVWKQ